MKLWNNDSELLQMVRSQLFSAVLADILDKMGHPNQFLPMEIRPAAPEMVVAGKALTVLGMDLSKDQSAEVQHPYGLLLDALDALKPDDIFVYTGGTPNYAIWGGLMSTRAIQLQAAGAVINGCYRDSKEILSLRFPTFGRGAYGPDQQSRGLIIDYNCPIKIGQVAIAPGDYLFGDQDGVVVIPQGIAEEVFAAAFHKRNTEDQLRLSLLNGLSAKEAFDKYGIF